MKKTIAVLLIAALLLGLCACTGQTSAEPLLPIVQGESNALRDAAVAYMKSMAMVEWTPKTRIDLSSINAGLVFEPGVAYMGLPYVNDIDSSLEEFSSMLVDGVYNGSPVASLCTGVDCSSSVLAAWAQVATSFSCVWTKTMMPQQNTGVLPLGGYTVPEGTSGSESIVRANDEQTIFRCYAQLLPGDAVVRYTSGGHARMVTAMPELIYNADGTLSDQSTVTITEIDSKYHETDGGRLTCWNIDKVLTFRALIDHAYIPLTLQELQAGENAEPELTLDKEVTAESVRAEGLTQRIKSNYRMISVTVTVVNENGEILREATGYPVTNVMLQLGSKTYSLNRLNNALTLSELPAGKLTLKVTARVRGEDVTVLELAL